MPKLNGKYTRTLVLLKPDAIERNLTGEILKRFERKGLHVVAAEMRWIDIKLAQEHYAEHKGNPSHYKSMTEALTRGPLMAVVLEGNSAVECSRQLIGAQSPLYNSQIGTIRADFAIEEPYNLVHGADSDNAAQREIKLWFGTSLTKVGTPPTSKAKPQITPMPEGKTYPLIAPPKLPKKVGTVPGFAPEQLAQYKDDMMQVLIDQGLLTPETVNA